MRQLEKFTHSLVHTGTCGRHVVHFRFRVDHMGRETAGVDRQTQTESLTCNYSYSYGATTST